jgi:hypothetical protein
MKFFVVSDVHSHFNFLKEALEEQGFEKNHKNHKLIINGDIFDRGEESQELKNFLDEIDNKMFVFGNHESLLLHAINRGNFMKHDLSNGTMDTAIQLTGGFAAYPEIKWGKLRPTFSPVEAHGNELRNKRIQKKIINRLIETNIVEWIVDNFYLEGSEVK